MKDDAKLNLKTQEINERKDKKAKELAMRMEAVRVSMSLFAKVSHLSSQVLRCREAKASANRSSHIKAKEEEERHAAAIEKIRESSSLVLDEELRRKREDKKREQAVIH